MSWVLGMLSLRCYWTGKGHLNYIDNHVSLKLGICLVKKTNEKIKIYLEITISLTHLFAYNSYISHLPTAEDQFFFAGEQILVLLSEIFMWANLTAMLEDASVLLFWCECCMPG